MVDDIVRTHKARPFMKTFKREYAYLVDLDDAETALRELPVWFTDYNENHPHKGLRMLSPNQFRQMKPTESLSGLTGATPGLPGVYEEPNEEVLLRRRVGV